MTKRLHGGVISKHPHATDLVFRFICVLAFGCTMWTSLTALSATRNHKMKPWFNDFQCTALEIKQFHHLSNQVADRSLSIHDAASIRALMERISRIPAQGDRMISFGDNVENIQLRFECGTPQVIEIYGGEFKTPSTAFNAPASEDEKRLYSDITALLSPSLNNPILKIKDLEISFDAFSITYLGKKTIDYTPATIIVDTDFFLITDKSGKTQRLEIRSGQLPPQPHDFQVGQKKYTILTYESNNNGSRLYPDYYLIKH